MKLPLLSLGFLLVLAAPLRAGDTLSFEADPYMPYTGDSDKGETGFMIDIVKAVFEPKGYTISYQSTPWNAALSHVKEGRITAIVGASKLDAPDLLFPKAEQGQAQGAFYTSIETGWKYSDAKSLETILLGIIADYKYNPEIGVYIAKNRGDTKKIRPYLAGADNLLSMASDTVDKKIGAFVEDRNVVAYFLKTFPKADRLADGGALKATTNLYVAFAPDGPNAQALADQLDAGIAALRSTGALAGILGKYGLTDWAGAK